VLRPSRLPLVFLLGPLAAVACGGFNPHAACGPSIVFTPAAAQGQVYEIHVGDTVTMNLTQVAIYCTIAAVDSARWESTNPAVATVSSVAGPTPQLEGVLTQFPARLVALQAGQTTVRAFYRRGGKEREADQSQLVQVLP
jgi:hypothetical protein